MELPNRVTWMQNGPGGTLVAADVTGRLHLLDEWLNLVWSSPASVRSRPAAGAPIYSMAVADPWVVTKDKGGTITRWSLGTLDPVDVLDARVTRDAATLEEDEEPSPIMSRGIAVHQGRVYVNNGYRQLAVIDLATFAVERIVPSVTGDASVECFCLDRPDLHVLSDQSGRLFFGSLDDLDFPRSVRLEGGSVHRVCYDPTRDQFWATLEESFDHGTAVPNGVVRLDPDGTVADRILFATDDVEVLAFSPDHSRVYSGGFDGELHVIDNTGEKPEIIRSLRGFTHQIIALTVRDDGTLNVLTQDGELVRITDEGEVPARAPWRRQCAWDVQPSMHRPNSFYVATDDGVAVVEQAESEAMGPYLRTVEHHVSGLGFTRRVRALPDGYVTISRDQKVTRCTDDGRVRWRQAVDSLCHTVSVSPDMSRILVAAGSGGVELDARTGAPLGRLDLDGLPAWASAYLDDGVRVLIDRAGGLRAFAPDSPTVIWNLELGDYPKRAWVRGGHLWVSGAGGVRQIPLYGERPARRFSELLDNTVENGTVVDGLVCAVSYGMQMAAYEYGTGELVGLVEDLPDFTKAITSVRGADGRPLVVVGGRGGVLELYRLDGGPEQGTFVKLRELHLPRTGVPAVRLTAVEV